MSFCSSNWSFIEFQSLQDPMPVQCMAMHALTSLPCMHSLHGNAYKHCMAIHANIAGNAFTNCMAMHALIAWQFMHSLHGTKSSAPH